MGRREDNKQAKRRALLAAGLARFTELGFDRASIEQVAADAGVARGTFYLYFPDKTALFRAVVTVWVDDLFAIVDEVHAAIDEAADGAELLAIYEQLGVALALMGLNHSDAVRLAFREGRRPGEAGTLLREIEVQILDRLTAMTQHACDRGLINVPDTRLTTLVIFGAVERIYYEVLNGADIGDPSAVANTVVRIFAVALGLPVPDALR